MRQKLNLYVKREISQFEGFSEASFDPSPFVDEGSAFVVEPNMIPNALVRSAQRILQEQVRIPQFGLVQ